MYKVLVVEDEMIIRKGLIYSFDFNKLGLQVVADKENGEQALEYIKNNDVDIVITDISMPIMDGLELAKNLVDTNIVIIFISGFSDFEYARNAIKYGVSEYLLKPLDFELLEESLKKAIKRIEKEHLIKKLAKVEITSEFYEEKLSDDKLFSELIEYIHNHYAEKLSLEDLSNAFNYSISTIKAKFKENDTSFSNELNAYRIKKAIDLFKENIPLYEVATMVGYSDYKYFSSVFKKYTGFSVTELTKS